MGANTAFMAGVPELLILRLLQDEEMYGYEIVRDPCRDPRSGPVTKGWSIPCSTPWKRRRPQNPAPPRRRPHPGLLRLTSQGCAACST